MWPVEFGGSGLGLGVGIMVCFRGIRFSKPSHGFSGIFDGPYLRAYRI